METITMCYMTVPGDVNGIRFRLEDGSRILYHSTGILTRPDEAQNNPELRNELDRHCLAMCKAYTMMQLRRMDMNNRIFENEVSRVLTDSWMLGVSKKTEPLYPRFLRYLEEAHRDGVIGDARYAVALSKARKLNRFLTIIGHTSLTARDFTTDHVLEFRRFISEEYRYVALFPDLYPRSSGHRPPQKRCCNTTVVHDLKLLQAFFAELENNGEVRRSPFRKISAEKRRAIMHVMYDAPIFLRSSELKHIMNAKVPSDLQWVKDLFVLNTAIGCRIGDLLRLTPDKIAVSDDGIPYVHYMPSKTIDKQSTNQELMTPLIEPAMEIIKRTNLKLMGPNLNYGRQRYNKALRKLLRFCSITRQVSLFCEDTGDNVYKPLCEVATSKLARKTHIDMLNKVQINYYVAGLHRKGSDAVFRYTSLELADRYALLRAAFEI
ncbi:MAG: hypothetical protein K5920_05570 [Bacteroidales bacterium]|nr:hypothetical protein [Bacteroidales bacterium]